MKITPSFVVASIVCAAPFALAVHDDLTRKHHDVDVDHDDYGDSASAFAHQDLGEYRGGDPYDTHADDNDRMTEDYPAPAPEPAISRGIKPSELADLIGPEPATMGPVLAGLVIGAPSTSFQPEESRERIAAYQADHEVSVDFDFDDVALNGITVRITGNEGELRDAMIAAWGNPRRLGEDELAWLRADGTRAVYTAMSDGVDLRFEHYATVDAIIAPKDRSKLGFEPFPLVGAKLARLEKALGPKLQESSYDDERVWSLPGIGNGSGKTMIHVGIDPTLTKIVSLTVEGSTDDVDAVRDALVAKWGVPKDEDGLLTWKKSGLTITAEIYDRGFVLSESR